MGRKNRGRKVETETKEKVQVQETPVSENAAPPELKEVVVVPEESQLPPEEIDPAIKKNVTAHHKAKEVIEFLKSECSVLKNQVRFWEVIRDESIKHAPLPVKEIPVALKVEPMPDEKAKEFLKEEFPRGQFEGKKVSYVLKKMPSYLKDYAFKPEPFQMRLRRLLARKEYKKI